jgi:hypothetical protein
VIVGEISDVVEKGEKAPSVAPHSADLIISQATLQDMDHTPDRDDLTMTI